MKIIKKKYKTILISIFLSYLLLSPLSSLLSPLLSSPFSSLLSPSLFFSLGYFMVTLFAFSF